MLKAVVMSLAKLVVHLESNYSGLVNGLNQSVAHVNELQSRVAATAPAVQQTRGAMSDLQRATQSAANEFQDLATSATAGLAAYHTVVTGLTESAEAIGTTLTGEVGEIRTVVTHMKQAADAAKRLRSAVASGAAEIPEVYRAATAAVDQLSMSAREAGFRIYWTAKSLDSAAAAAQVLAKIRLPAVLVDTAEAAYLTSWNMLRYSGIMVQGAGATGVAAAKGVLLVHGFTVMLRILAPVITAFRKLMVAAMTVANLLTVISVAASLVWEGMVLLGHAFLTLKYLVYVAIAPVWMFYKAVSALVTAIWRVLKPFILLYFWFYRLKLQWKAAKLTLEILGKLFGALDWRLKLLIVTLGGLGLSSRVAAFAINALGMAATALSFAGRLVATGLVLLFNPIMAAKIALTLLVDTAKLATWILSKLATVTSWVATKMGRLGKASLSALNTSLGNVLTRMLSLRTAIAATAVAATVGFGGMGIKLAAAAETAHIPYQNILRDATAAKKLIADIEDHAAMTPFQSADLIEAGRVLLTAGAPARDLVHELKMLGEVASGTQTDIKEIANVYMKVRSTGKLSMEELNSLARRGVPIYETLQQALGTNRDEMLRMISDGAVGFATFHEAIRLTTDGAAAGSNAVGIFADATAKQSQTISGLFSTLKDNFFFLARAFGEQIVSAIDLKHLLSEATLWLQVWKTKVTELRPAIAAAWEVSKAWLHESIWLLKVVAQSFGFTGTSLTDLVDKFVYLSAIVKWGLENWPDIANFVFLRMTQYVTEFGAELEFWFLKVLPRAVMNLPTVLKIAWQAMSQLSHLSKKLTGDTLERAQNMVVNRATADILAAVKIPTRARTEAERDAKAIADAAERGLVGTLSDGMTEAAAKAEEIRRRMKDAAAQHATDMAAVDLGNIGQAAEQTAGIEDDLNGQIDHQVEVKVAGALKQGTQEAYSAIIQAMNSRRDNEEKQIAKQQLVVQQQTKQVQEDIRDELQNRPAGKLLMSLG